MYGVYRMAQECQDRRMSSESVGATLGLGTAAFPDVVVQAVSFILGFLAFIQMVMVLYAGFVLLTARGNDERIHIARMTILRSSIGFVVISVAWAIVVFLFQRVGEATT